MATRCLLLIWFVVSLCPPAFAQDRVVFPRRFPRWTAAAPPQYESKDWYKANYSDYEWVVAMHKGRVVIKAPDSNEPEQPQLPFKIEQTKNSMQFNGLRYVVKVDDGWIVGFNAGEWGGSLWWFSPDGKKRSMISKDQVSEFLKTKASLLALAGLAHMTLNSGKIIRLHKVKGHWRTEPFVDLKHAPRAATLDVDGSMIVATTDRLLRVYLNRKIHVLVAYGNWKGIYPNSMVRAPSGNLYLGARYAVIRIKDKGRAYKVEWLVPDALRKSKFKWPQ